ncbi:hypothetical protein [Polyangium jinanense]|uniref:Outer membrane protein beta-barrel domain-containing protein n=1 Tax=Polyangium jinanense TaxID=2829994 RepID=A0A9X3XER9_9BACT|nr:hypothetical protein [Polyangium jinanense]MDC3960456.1 hypothetical protein [Polyangium jinanense]MDC3986771.1 hypothetical protein [Polyangium jinanense]
MSKTRLACWVFGFITTIATLGCNANHYATPRTVPKGKTSHTIALEGYGAFEEDGRLFPAVGGPRYLLRAGLGERVDFGLTLSGTVISTDVKLNFLRTKWVDMAVSPGVELGVLPGYHADDTEIFFRGAVPLSLGFNVSKATSIYLHGGLGGFVHSQKYDEWCYNPECDDTRTGLTVQGGLGAQFRVSNFVALQPELSVMGSALPGVFMQLGFGVSLGAQPSYPEFD